MNRRTMILGSIGAAVGAALPMVAPVPHEHDLIISGGMQELRGLGDLLNHNRKCTLNVHFAGGAIGFEYFDNLRDMIARAESLPPGAIINGWVSWDAVWNDPVPCGTIDIDDEGKPL
jgi:hypothetical protein